MVVTFDDLVEYMNRQEAIDIVEALDIQSSDLTDRFGDWIEKDLDRLLEWYGFNDEEELDD